MRTAITSQGNSLEAKLDQRFGHCSFFVIYDQPSGAMEIIPNPFSTAEEHAGTMAAKLLAEKKVDKIVSGEFGVKVKPILDSLHIQMIMLKGVNKTVKQIIELLNHTNA